MDWRAMQPVYDASGLLIDGKSIVEFWEDSIQKEMARSIRPKTGGNILEIGYGLGLSSKEIVQFNPVEHVIIEAHPEVLKKALEEMPVTTKLFLGMWESSVQFLKPASFDGIIFDAYPMNALPFDGTALKTLAQVKPFFNEGFRLLVPGGKMAFLDFSTNVNLQPDFDQAVQAFSNITVKEVTINADKDCTYASAGGANIVILTK